MDLNINELPEDKDRKPDIMSAARPEPRASNAPLKIAGFLAVVVVMTALAINSHQSSTQSTMAPDTPPAVAGATTLPTATAPTERGTTGRAPSAPTIAPNPPSEAAAGANSNQ